MNKTLKNIKVSISLLICSWFSFLASSVTWIIAQSQPFIGSKALIITFYVISFVLLIPSWIFVELIDSDNDQYYIYKSFPKAKVVIMISKIFYIWLGPLLIVILIGSCLNINCWLLLILQIVEEAILLIYTIIVGIFYSVKYKIIKQKLQEK